MNFLGLNLPAICLVLGVSTGLAYGLLGVGLVLVFRSSRFINFAHSQIGAFGGAALAIMVANGGVPYWVAVPLAMVLGAAVGGAVEVGVVRRMRSAPRLMSMVATVGVGQFLLYTSLAVSAKSTSGDYYPLPPGLPTFKLDNVPVTQAYTGMMLIGPIVVVLLAVFFTKSRYGLAIRASAANADAAAVAGMSPARMTTLTWAIAGGVATLTSILVIPTIGAIGAATLGPTLLLRALAASVIGRMRSLVVTFVAGIGIGILDQVVRFNAVNSGVTEAILTVVVVVALLLQAKPGRREDEKSSWLAVQPWRPLPEALRAVWAIRNLGSVVGIPVLAAALSAPFWLSNGSSLTVATALSYAIVGISLTIVSGLSGQLSLGQFGVAAIGALVGIPVATGTGSYELGIVAAIGAGAIAGTIIGIPALRVQGLLLAVATLGFSLSVGTWLLKLNSPLGFGTSRLIGQLHLFGIQFHNAKAYLTVAIVGTLLAVIVASNVRRSSFGRLLVALRDNEDAARAFSVSAPARRLQGYAVAGGLAGLGGIVFAYSQTSVSAAGFDPSISMLVITITVVGGLGLVAGPLLGAVIAIPALTTVSIPVAAGITFAWLVLILYMPTGVAGVIRPARERVIALFAKLSHVDVAAAWASVDPALADVAGTSGALSILEPAQTTQLNGVGNQPLLEVRGIRKSYGGLHAVDGVDLVVREHEVLGLIGPNGAGKTTTFECLSGFVKVDAGEILFDGRDVTRWSPEHRARVGLIRSFQDSALFPTMTVLESAMVATERRSPTRLVPSLMMAGIGEKQREDHARDLLNLLGMDRYRHTQIGALSTGTRRIAELACLVALEPRLMLLDEPSSGVAQREVEALGEVLKRIQAHLGASMVIIEHDIPLVSGLADRMIAMETGKVLSEGTPEHVLTDPAVVVSYLGGDPAAVQRSSQRATPVRRSRSKVAPEVNA